MPAVPYPYEDPYVWNTLILGSYVLPGRAECVNGVPLSRKKDTKKASGKSGATQTDKGYEPEPFDFNLHIINKAQHDEWERIYPLISPRREAAASEPFEALNAYVFEAGITNVTILNITPGKWSTQGKRIIKIRLQEWFAEAKTVKKSTGKPKPASTNVKAMVGDLLGQSMAPGQLNPVGNGLTDPSAPANVQSMVGDLLGMSR